VKPHDTNIETTISDILRWGVRGSLFLMVAGSILCFATGGHYADRPGNLAALIDGRHPIEGTARWFSETLASDPGTVLIALGLALLVATPPLRVAASVVGYAIERDNTYALISAAVLAFVIMGLCLGGS
jgi:uncharacterized membrane protein